MSTLETSSFVSTFSLFSYFLGLFRLSTCSNKWKKSKTGTQFFEWQPRFDFLFLVFDAIVEFFVSIYDFVQIASHCFGIFMLSDPLKLGWVYSY